MCFRACLDQAEDETFARFEAKESRVEELGNKDGCKLVKGLSDMFCFMAVRMGHAKAPLPLDLYAHAIPANDYDAANIMGTLYVWSLILRKSPASWNSPFWISRRKSWRSSPMRPPSV